MMGRGTPCCPSSGGAIDSELPLKTEISLVALVRVTGDDWEEKGASLDLPADRLIPDVPAPELALVEPDLDTCSAKCLADRLGSSRILRRVADEDRGRRPLGCSSPPSAISGAPTTSVASSRMPSELATRTDRRYGITAIGG